LALAILRLAIGAAIISYIIGNTLPKIGMYGIFAVVVIAFFIFMSPNLEKQSNKMTKTFTDNLNEREQNQ
jgi:type VI protein secretion system component VasF